ncbi:MAG: autotransporter outer membrane beta-barrel domain-containing protein [Alphaproteobacteria bacterium]|nr:autotransporter outer membrane beta-barrel domain-containing protein [Alphaproteobacteria bacterium]
MSASADEIMVHHQIVVTPQLMIENAHQLQKSVSSAARLALVPDGDELVSVSSYGSTSDSQDGTAPAADPRWNLWINGSFTRLDDKQPISGYDSDQTVGLAGIDFKLTEYFILGALINGTWSDTTNTGSGFPGNSSSDGWGAGIYGAAIIASKLVADASWIYTETDNTSFDGTDTASYSSDGWIAAGNLTLYHYVDNWRFSPSIGVNYAYNSDDAYTDSGGFVFPSQKQETGVVEFGGQIGYTHQTQDSGTVEFWTGLLGEWTFKREVSPSFGTVTPIPTRGDDLDARVSAGVDFQFNDSFSLSLSGEIGGLAINDFNSAGGSARAALTF